MDINTFKLILMTAVILLFVVLMMKKKVSAIVALPTMGILVAIIGAAGTYPMLGLFDFATGEVDAVTGEPIVVVGVFNDVISGGIKSMSLAISSAIFGAALARLLNKTHVTETIIKKAAELAGDNKTTIAIIFYFAITFVFFGLNGLGATIIVGTVALPILVAAGLSPLTAAMVFLFGLTTGAKLNPANFGVYISLLQPMYGSDTQNIIVQQTYGILAMVIPILLTGIILNVRKENYHQRNWAAIREVTSETHQASWLAMLSPIIPVVIVLSGTFTGYAIPIEVAIITAIIYLALVSRIDKKIQTITQCFIEGISDVSSVILLLMGIGILIEGFQYSAVTPVIQPVIEGLIVYLQNPWTYVFGFTIAAPLVLYRGPLNTYGIGGALPALFASAGFNPLAITYALRATSTLQSAGDPTNSHNIWTADYLKIDTNEILKKVFIWGMLCAFAVLFFAAFIKQVPMLAG